MRAQLNKFQRMKRRKKNSARDEIPAAHLTSIDHGAKLNDFDIIYLLFLISSLLMSSWKKNEYASVFSKFFREFKVEGIGPRADSLCRSDILDLYLISIDIRVSVFAFVFFSVLPVFIT